MCGVESLFFHFVKVGISDKASGNMLLEDF